MKHLITFLALLIPAFVFAQGSEQVNLEDMTDEHGVETVFSVNEDMLSRTPAWDPQTQEPPLSITKAVSIARKWMIEKHPKFDDVKLTDIQLRQTHCSPTRVDRWHYFISFEAVVDGQTFMSWNAGMNVVVLMDGTVVPPTQKSRNE